MKNYRIFYLILMCITSFSLFAQRQEVSLDGNGWKFQVDRNSIGHYSWYNGLPEARNISAPHTWNVENGLEEFYGTAWYEKEVNIPTEWNNKKIRLHFEAVYRDIVLYINGKEIAQSKGLGYTPLSFDVTKMLEYGKSNKIILSVSNKYSDYSFPYQKSFDWPNDGGIIRPVKLIVTGNTSVRYAHIKPETNFKDSTATAVVKIKLWEDTKKKTKFILKFSKQDTGELLFNKTVELEPVNGIFRTNLSFENILPWHFDSPNLYDMQVEVHDKKGYSDIYSTHFGFRKIEIKGHQLFLNEEPVRLPGVEYMPGSYPMYGMAEPERILSQAVTLMKNLNCVITRFHWQQDSRILDLMDKNGILVQQEIPWWQAPGNLSAEQEALAKQHIDAMIERDYNRPSIFSWGVSNEVYNNTDKDIYRRLIFHVREWDTSALAGVVSNEIFNRLENDESLLGDIPTWNDYVGTWHGNHREETPGMLKLINERALKGRPLLITEHGLCEPRFVGGDPRRITEMAYHYDQWAKNDYIMGAIYFSLNDYRTHMGESGKGRYKARIHGLTDLWFNKKPSYEVYKGLASPVYFESVQSHSSGQSADVVLIVKNELPSYTIRNYKLVWKTASGKEKEVIIPKLNPGEKYKVTIDNLNPETRIELKVVRPTGFVVAEYY